MNQLSKRNATYIIYNITTWGFFSSKTQLSRLYRFLQPIFLWALLFTYTPPPFSILQHAVQLLHKKWFSGGLPVGKFYDIPIFQGLSVILDPQWGMLELYLQEPERSYDEYISDFRYYGNQLRNAKNLSWACVPNHTVHNYLS